MRRTLKVVIALVLPIACDARPLSSNTTETDVTRLGGATSSLVDATPILTEMCERYASARSYEDRGVLMSTWINDDGSPDDHSSLTFKTAFDRASGDFSFRTSKSDRFSSPSEDAIWGNSSGPVHVWLVGGFHDDEANLDRAIGAFAGVSSRTSVYVPQQLITPTCPVQDGPDFVVEGEEAVGSVMCVKVTQTEDRDILTFWISTEDHSLRRVFAESYIDTSKCWGLEEPDLTEEERQDIQKECDDHAKEVRSFTVQDTIDYDPVFDRPVDPAHFEFTPRMQITGD